MSGRRAPEPRAVVVVLGHSLGRAGSAGLCERVRVRLQNSRADVLVCDVGAVTAPDAGTVDALARVALTARRLGCSVRVRHARPELQELVALAGLGDALGLPSSLCLGMRGQAEEREEPGRVEEEGHPTDPAG